MLDRTDAHLIYSPSTVKVAAHVTVPAEFEATHEYSPSWSGRTLEISNRQVPPEQDILKMSDCGISLSLQNQVICRSGDTAFIHTQDRLNHNDLLSNSFQTKSGPGDLDSKLRQYLLIQQQNEGKEGATFPRDAALELGWVSRCDQVVPHGSEENWSRDLSHSVNHFWT